MEFDKTMHFEVEKLKIFKTKEIFKRSIRGVARKGI